MSLPASNVILGFGGAGSPNCSTHHQVAWVARPNWLFSREHPAVVVLLADDVDGASVGVRLYPAHCAHVVDKTIRARQDYSLLA
jgi:hypothetical protein